MHSKGISRRANNSRRKGDEEASMILGMEFAKTVTE
jgi:hypothetical protein